MAAPSLIFLAGPNAGRRYKLGEGDYIIGRRSDCQIFVPDMRVSRQHARVRRENGAWHVEDLGSNNGTYVNGSRVQTVPLCHDDEITIANNRIRVEIPNALKPGTEFDSHVTIVDLNNPAIFISSDEASDSGKAWSPAIAFFEATSIASFCCARSSCHSPRPQNSAIAGNASAQPNSLPVGRLTRTRPGAAIMHAPRRPPPP